MSAGIIATALYYVVGVVFSVRNFDRFNDQLNAHYPLVARNHWPEWRRDPMTYVMLLFCGPMVWPIIAVLDPFIETPIGTKGWADKRQSVSRRRGEDS